MSNQIKFICDSVHTSNTTTVRKTDMSAGHRGMKNPRLICNKYYSWRQKSVCVSQ